MSTKDQEKERYRKGFNHGYTLAEAGIKLPKLEQQGKSGNKKVSKYVDGLKEGTKEFQREKDRQKGVKRLRSAAKKAPPTRKAPTKSRGR